MIGLIKKDLLMIKSNIKLLVVIFIVFGLMGINGNMSFTFIPVFLSVMLIMSTFSYDNYNKTDAYITALPNGKINAVKSKYLATLLIILITSIITLLLEISVGIYKNNLNLEETLNITLGTISGIIIIESIMYPIIYKFGVEKSRIGIFVGAFGFSGLVMLISKSGFKLHISESLIAFLESYYLIIIPLVVFIILGISYILSKRIYLKKEF